MDNRQVGFQRARFGAPLLAYAARRMGSWAANRAGQAAWNAVQRIARGRPVPGDRDHNLYGDQPSASRRMPKRRRGMVPYQRSSSSGSLSRSTLAHMKCVETKFIDKLTAVAACPSTGRIDPCIGDIPVANGQSARDGGVVWIKKLSILANFYPASTAATHYTVKWMVVLDTQANGTAPTWAGLCTTTTPFAFRDLDNVARFKVLKGGIFQLGHTGGSYDGTLGAYVGGGRLLRVNLDFSKNPIKVLYNGDDGDSAEITNNNIWLLTVSDSASSVSQATYCRLRYTD